MPHASRPPGHWVRYLFTLAGIWLVALAMTPRHVAAQCSNTSLSMGPCNTSMTEAANTSNVRVVFDWGNLLAIQQQVDPSVTCTGYVTSCRFTTAFVHMAAHGSGTDTVVFSTGTGSSGSFTVTGGGLSSKITVNGPTHVAPIASLPYYNYDNVQPSLCAENCFDKVLAYTTPAYYTLDAPRSVTLMYRSNVANPMVTVQVDGLDNSFTPPAKMSLKIQRPGGSLVTYTNGSTELFFTFSTQINPNRLAGQFAPQGADTLTGAYNYTAIVTSYFADNTVLSTSIPIRILLENERSSRFGVGWMVAGQQTIYPQSNGDVVITDGMGAISYFTLLNPPCTQSCSYRSPTGDYTVLTTKAQDDFGRHYDRRYPEGTTYEFLGDGRLAGIFDKNGNQAVYWYDSQGRDSLISDPLGTSFSFGIHFNYGDTPQFAGGWKIGAIRTICDPYERCTWFGVGATAGDQNQIEDPYGGQYGGIMLAVNASYNAQHQMTSNIDRHQAAWHFGYDFAGKLAADSAPAVLADGATQSIVTKYQSAESTFLINPSSGVGTSSSPANFEGGGPWWANVYDPEGNHTAFTVDRWGQPLTVNDAAGGTTLYFRGGGAYVMGGIPPLIINYPWGGSDNFRFNATGLLSWSQLAGHDSTTYLYRNSFAIPDSIFGPNQQTISRSVDGSGRILSETVRNSVTTYGYDSRNRVTSIANGKNDVTQVHYDSVTGNLSNQVFPGSRSATLTFDLYGRRYSSAATSVPTTYTWYDALNRITKMYGGAMADTTRYFYDSVYLTHVQDAKGQWYRATVNALGWTTRVYDPSDTVNVFQSYLYDRTGNVTQYTNRRGQSVAMTYDPLGRILSKSGTGVTPATYTYSSNQRVITGANSISVDTIQFNTNGWLSAAKTTFLTNGSSGPQYTMSYTPGTNWQLQSETVTGTTGIAFASRTYTWDPVDGCLSGLTIASQQLFFFCDDITGHFDEIGYGDPNAVTSIIREDDELANSRVSQTQFFFNNGSNDQLDNNVFGRFYYYDGIARITQVNSGSVTQSFQYDSLNRVSVETDYTSATCSAVDTVYGYNCAHGSAVPADSERYDVVGNLMRSNTATLTYGAGNRLQTENSTQYTLDADGNVIRRFDTTHDMRYGWSPEGFLVSDTVHGTGAVEQFDYNAFGRLVRRSTNGTPDHYYLWDRDELLAELDGSASHRIEEYVHVAGQPVAIITGATSIAATRYPIQDHLGNVIGVFAPGTPSTVYQTLKYSPFGQFAITGGTMGDTSRLRWRGLMWQGDSTQLYYVRSRWYDPNTGRFMSQDPLGIAGGVNSYAFAGGDYINGSDPFGTCADDEVELGGDPETSILGADGYYYHACISGNPGDSTFTVYYERDGSNPYTGELGGGGPLDPTIITAAANPNFNPIDELTDPGLSGPFHVSLRDLSVRIVQKTQGLDVATCTAMSGTNDAFLFGSIPDKVMSSPLEVAISVSAADAEQSMLMRRVGVLMRAAPVVEKLSGPLGVASAYLNAASECAEKVK